MATGSAIDREFTYLFNEAHDLYVEGWQQESLEKAHELIGRPDAPRYHVMKTWILIGSMSSDWDEANEYRVKTETMWRAVRAWHPDGQDDVIDVALADIRESLDEFHQSLQNDEPEGFDLEDELRAYEQRQTSFVEEPQANMEDSNHAECDEDSFLDSTLYKLLVLQNRMLNVSNEMTASKDIDEDTKEEQLAQIAELGRIIALVHTEQERQEAEFQGPGT